MQAIAEATSGLPPAKNRTLKRGGDCYPARAGGKTGLVGFRRLHMQSCPPVQSARGAAIKRPHPVRFLIGSVRHQPRSFLSGRYGAAPRSKGWREAQSGSRSGEDFPLTKKLIPEVRNREY